MRVPNETTTFAEQSLSGGVCLAVTGYCGGWGDTHKEKGAASPVGLVGSVGPELSGSTIVCSFVCVTMPTQPFLLRRGTVVVPPFLPNPLYQSSLETWPSPGMPA